jgi:NAD(P)-dependent dehydrogenase (short-subunit alcohol dehydrogenase family)
MPSYLITGASRGLGLAFATELVRCPQQKKPVQSLIHVTSQLKNPENHVIATARSTAVKGLIELVNSSPKGKIDLVKLDVLDAVSIKEAVTEVSKLLPNGLDIFVSNAGASLQPLVPFEKV